jgi:hypothetical protein
MSRALCKLDAVRTVLLVSPLAVAMLMTACAPEGAGSIHIKERKKFVDTGTGQVPKASAKVGSGQTRGKSAPSLRVKNRGQKDH